MSAVAVAPPNPKGPAPQVKSPSMTKNGTDGRKKQTSFLQTVIDIKTRQSKTSKK